MTNNIFTANKELNKKELKERKLVLQSKPLRLGIVVTNRCNLRCIMCNVDRRIGHSTLSKQALENTYEALPYLERINWQGGEVFLIEYMKDVFRDMLPYPDILHEITTNGLLLDEEWIELLLNLNVRFTLSIDSVVPKTYEYIRRPARFDDLISKIELLDKMERRHNRKIDKEITVVVMKSNLDELELFVDFAKRYNFPIVEFYPISHIEIEEYVFQNMTPEFSQLLDSRMADIENLAQDAGIRVANRLPKNNHAEGVAPSLQEASVAKEIFCTLPWTCLWVDASKDGDVVPNCMCKHVLGNINDDTILKFWNNNEMIGYRKNMLRNNLGLCNEDCVSGMVDPRNLNIYLSHI